AGSVHMKYWHFVIFDGLAALVSAPVFVFLGFRFGDELEGLIRAVRQGQLRVLLGLVIVIGAYVVGTRLWSRWRGKASSGPPPQLPEQQSLTQAVTPERQPSAGQPQKP